MQLSDFRATYPRLFTKLVDHRANAIAKTPTYLQSQQRGLINVANYQMREIDLDSPIFRRSSEFFEQIPTALVRHDSKHGEHSERYRLLEATVAEAQAELSRIGKLLPTSPTANDYAKARCEVESYLTAYLQHGSKAIAHLDLSAVEQYQLSQLYWKVNGFTRVIDHDWEYLVAKGDDYNALVEPVIESYTLGGESVAHVTKNSYGVLCLNATRVMFIDIDFNYEAEDIACGALPWGRGEPSKPGEKMLKRNPGSNIHWGRVQAEESEILANIYEVAKDTGLIFEIYRTANGFRLIEMSRTWDANSYESQALLERLGSDRLYQKLCLAQGCYRARLQPKPWRSGDTVCLHVGTASEASDLSAFKLCPPLHQECLYIKSVHDGYCVTGGEDLA